MSNLEALLFGVVAGGIISFILVAWASLLYMAAAAIAKIARSFSK